MPSSIHTHPPPAECPSEVPQAFRAGDERLIGWPADPRDGDYWRAEAGLPAHLAS
ncbi:hypothetical protein AB0G42_33420 [Streptomyces yangpuensis]|uniref:hypothetical protein n=1 Tax=Streptomyces yangpuensis TaxID=1648182 RepID=UPI00342FA1E4